MTTPLPISVVLPTLNCARYLPEHLESMRPWLDLVQEVVVVDSHSDDGTVQLIRDGLKHPQVSVHLRPRGLYQAWNFGIAQLRSKYTYVSTVGDSITRAGLEHLHAVAERLACDVVVSKPRFINSEGSPMVDDVRWPIDDVLTTLHVTEPMRLEGLKLLLFVMTNTTGAILGSSASNLYRVDVLQRYPFPTEFGTSGDCGWGILNVFDYKLGVTPEKFSTFRQHPKAYSAKEYAVEDLNSKLFKLACAILKKRCEADAALRAETTRIGCDELVYLLNNHLDWQYRLEKERARKWPWIFNPAAWRARSKRTHFGQLMEQRKRTLLELAV